jgi:hypothetical protein
MRAADSPLRLATKELHHAAEAHPVGASMADGTMRPEWWADWLQALHMIHMELDKHIPSSLARASELMEDVEEMSRRGFQGAFSEEANWWVQELQRNRYVNGSAYVFTGAHLMGGAITERAIGTKLPCAHLRWNNRAQSLTDWQPFRTYVTEEADARMAFRCVLAILEEIKARHP